MKITKKYKKIATFLIGCLTMITYSFRNLLYLILKGIRLWKKGYSSCFDEDYQQYTKHIIKYVDNHFNNDKNIKILIPNALMVYIYFILLEEVLNWVAMKDKMNL